MSALKWLLLLAVLGVAVWWFTRDPVEAAYQKCLSSVSSEMNRSIQADASNPVEKAVADALKGMGSAIGSAGCEAMRSACKNDRDGAICKAALAQF